MTEEVLRGIAEGAVKTAMSIEPMVEKTMSGELLVKANLAVAFACIPLAVLLVTIALSLRK